MIDLRPYQQEAIDAVFAYWGKGGGSPLVDMATGLGKSVVIATLTRQLIETYPDLRVLMLVHVRELVDQNFKALKRLWPEAPAGVYSAGLNRREAHHRITFASIQSVYKKARILGPRDIVMIDEAHLVPSDGDGTYRSLIDKLRIERPDLRLVGFTATPYRMDAGRLDAGGMFDDTVYSFGIGRGIREGWLAPLVSKASAVEIDVSGVAKRGGEFIAGALEDAADVDAVTRAAVQEMIRYGADRRSWLVFCTGVKHAHHVGEALRDAGISAATITGATPSAERWATIDAFKRGQIQALTNANVLTTGFDAPGVDMIAFLRPTLSTGLYVQMVGRGTRKAEGKENCLILDFAGNVRRHGPVDIATIDREPGDGADTSKVPVDKISAKKCPSCDAMVAIAAHECPHCFYKWPLKEVKHAKVADDIPILSTEPAQPAGIYVHEWNAVAHTKPEKPPSVRVFYWAGLTCYSEWVFPEYTGYSRTKFERWWAQHGGKRPPATVLEALSRWDELTMPAEIYIRAGEKWNEVVGRRFGQPRVSER